MGPSWRIHLWIVRTQYSSILFKSEKENGSNTQNWKISSEELHTSILSALSGCRLISVEWRLCMSSCWNRLLSIGCIRLVLHITISAHFSHCIFLQGSNELNNVNTLSKTYLGSPPGITTQSRPMWTTSYCPFNLSGTGLKISITSSLTFEGSNAECGYWLVEMSNPSNCAFVFDSASSFAKSMSQILQQH